MGVAHRDRGEGVKPRGARKRGNLKPEMKTGKTEGTRRS